MESVIGKKYYGRAFYALIILILATCAIFRFLYLPVKDPTLDVSLIKVMATILDGLMTSLIVTIAIASFVLWLTPKVIEKSVMEVLYPKEISPLLKKATANTKSWIYKGACGRYMRSTTLPEISAAAKQEGIGREINITILNPNNDNSCAEYAIYRRSLKSATSENPWTKNRVKEEALATALSALRFRHEEPLLRIYLYLIDHFSAFRLDISDQYAIVTKEDKEATGLRADAGTYFYDSYKDDIRLSERQSKEISYQGPVPVGSNLTEETLKSLILEVNLISERSLDELNISNIIKGINSPEDPYGR